MDASQFEAAGLYDPREPHAAERLELLAWLASRGVTIDQMLYAAREASLEGLAGDLALRPIPRLTLADVAGRVGLSGEQIREISLATGLRIQSPDERAFTDEDVEMFRAFVAGSALLGATPIRRFARTMGAALAQIAEAAVALYLAAAEGPLRASKASPLALAQQNLRGMQSLGAVDVALHALFRTHMALTLFERFAGDQSVTPRGGLAVGELLSRGGDYYGPIVNLAARLADLAVPQELLVTREVAAQGAQHGLRFDPAGKRMLKGFDEPVTVLTVERA